LGLLSSQGLGRKGGTKKRLGLLGFKEKQGKKSQNRSSPALPGPRFGCSCFWVFSGTWKKRRFKTLLSFWGRPFLGGGPMVPNKSTKKKHLETKKNQRRGKKRKNKKKKQKKNTLLVFCLFWHLPIRGGGPRGGGGGGAGGGETSFFLGCLYGVSTIST